MFFTLLIFTYPFFYIFLTFKICKSSVYTTLFHITYFWHIKFTNWALKKSFRSLYFLYYYYTQYFIISMYPFLHIFNNWNLQIEPLKSHLSLYSLHYYYTQYLDNYLDRLINLKHIPYFILRLFCFLILLFLIFF